MCLGRGGMDKSWSDCLRDEVASQLHRGEPLAVVERELIEPAQGLSEDERAALWRFAWSYRRPSKRDAGRLTGGLAR